MEKLNAYVCQKDSSHVRFTRQRSDCTIVTPFGLGCHRCDGHAYSVMHMLRGAPVPVRMKALIESNWFEWRSSHTGTPQDAHATDGLRIVPLTGPLPRPDFGPMPAACG